LRVIDCSVMLRTFEDGGWQKCSAKKRPISTEVPLPARTIIYCGGGIAASSNALILAAPGVKNVAVYDGSLSEWTSDPQAPMEAN
jgi:thiosulfate/3-mercaptopyruvate sulfurtransferase